MSFLKLVELKKVDLKDPVLIHGVPGVGLVSKIAVSHLINQLKAELIAEIYGDLIPLPDGNAGISVDGSQLEIPSYRIYHARSNTGRSLLLVTSEAQPIPWGQYQVINLLLDYAEKLGTKLVISLGGYVTDEGLGVYGAAYPEEMLDEMGIYGVKRLTGGYVTGAAGVVVGLAKVRGMRSICLLGTTPGSLPDPKAAMMVLSVLEQWLGVKTDMSELVEMDEVIRESTKPKEVKTQETEGKKEEGVPYHT
jgi:uncharacterized protein (TIGR00162 family)